MSLPYQGRWILPQAKDGEVFVSDGHILFVWPKRIWKEKSTKEGARKAPLFGNTPRCGGGNGIVPHNKRLNLSVHSSFSAQDAAAFWRLFGATGISPRYISAPPP